MPKLNFIEMLASMTAKDCCPDCGSEMGVESCPECGHGSDEEDIDLSTLRDGLMGLLDLVNRMMDKEKAEAEEED